MRLLAFEHSSPIRQTPACELNGLGVSETASERRGVGWCPREIHHTRLTPTPGPTDPHCRDVLAADPPTHAEGSWQLTRVASCVQGQHRARAHCVSAKGSGTVFPSISVCSSHIVSEQHACHLSPACGDQMCAAPPPRMLRAQDPPRKQKPAQGPDTARALLRDRHARPRGASGQTSKQLPGL